MFYTFSALTYILLATLAISFASLLGVITITVKKEKLHDFLIYTVALSAGTLMGGAFFHLLPEALDTLSLETAHTLVVVSFIIFFLIEKVLGWHHHHEGVNDIHTVGLMNLFGDALHNFLDGLIIAAAFYTDINLGIATTLAVALHEIPQEIGDFGVLLHSGFNKNKALLANLGVSLFAVMGGLLGYFWVDRVDFIVPYITALAAGGFIYISTSDLLPEIRQEENILRSWVSFFIFLLGIGIMLLL